LLLCCVMHTHAITFDDLLAYLTCAKIPRFVQVLGFWPGYVSSSKCRHHSAFTAPAVVPQAVTCDDFLAAMADANGEDLSGIGRWYSQAGTPTLTVSTAYDAAKKSCTISTHQVTPPTNGQPDKLPVLIPLKVRSAGFCNRYLGGICNMCVSSS
jgi:hypothetical protein